MFDIGWMELLLIGVVALIVIGPKDLPDMFRQLGRFTAKLRSMAREFQRAMDQAAKESGAADLAKDVKAMANPKSMGVDAVRSAADKFEKWDPLKNTIKPTAAPTIMAPLTPPPMPATAPVVAAPAAAAPVGPATQALYEKQAAKQAVLKEAAARLQSIDSGAAAVTPKAARAKPAAAKVAEPVAPAKPTRARAAKASATPAVAEVAAPPKPARKPARKPASSEPK